MSERGRHATRTLRQTGCVPAVVYSIGVIRKTYIRNSENTYVVPGVPYA
ncbi:MAG: hypothetical protein E7268_11070 [Lachnospiraceae bacterium]|nr:hypothetical protein [Lachnospiraceae bacterium]